MTMLSYADARDTLARYVRDAVPLFADRFSRWPGEEYAYEIIKILEKEIPYYESLCPEYFDDAIVSKLWQIHAILKARICGGE